MIEALSDAFGPFGEHVWLNCAHQGPLPLPAAEIAEEMIGWKRDPRLIQDSAFWEGPEELRRVLARVVGANDHEIVLGNSTTYGLNLLVQGIPWREGDEVLVVHGDFPTSVMAWMPLQDRGVDVRLLKPSGRVPTPDELEESLRPHTRVFCTSWVFSFNGGIADLEGLGEVCRRRDVTFVVNGTQGVGQLPIDVSALPVDALVSGGFKWLCGPYGTGFMWLTDELMTSLNYKQCYWLAHSNEEDLSREGAYDRKQDLGVRGLDVFGTANFLNFVPWRRAIDLLLDVGIANIRHHNERLAQRLIAGLIEESIKLMSPTEPDSRSSLLLIQARNPARQADLETAFQKARIWVASRAGAIRISPHLYNSGHDIDRALEVLETIA